MVQQQVGDGSEEQDGAEAGTNREPGEELKTKTRPFVFYLLSSNSDFFILSVLYNLLVPAFPPEDVGVSPFIYAFSFFDNFLALLLPLSSSLGSFAGAVKNLLISVLLF